MRGSSGIALAVVLLVSPVPGGAAATVDVTTCGQTVPRGARGTLTQDLVCDGTSDAIRLEARATLDLAGFSVVITGSPSGGDVPCLAGKCTILGPGEVRGSGVWAEAGRLEMRDVTLRDGAIAIAAERHAKLDDVTVDGFSVAGVLAPRLEANGLRVRNVTVQLHAAALSTTAIRGSGIEVADNDGPGILARSIRASNVTVRDNAGVGITTVHARLESSTLVDNDPSGEGIDLDSLRRPRLLSTTCRRSRGPGGPWGVCAEDELPPCAAAPGPACGGSCPGNGTCVADVSSPDFSTCRCVSELQPCGETYPVCGGTCPDGEGCVAIGTVPFGSCVCTPIGVTPCGAAAFPTCGGACPDGQECYPGIVPILGEERPFCGCAPPGSCGASFGECPDGLACAVLPPGSFYFCIAP